MAQAGVVPSFNWFKNLRDNAEASWSTLKTELLPHGTTFASLKETCPEVPYIYHEVVYE